MDELRTVCACGSPEHQFSLWIDEGDLVLLVHLAQHRFIDRIWTAIKYVFGYRSKYGDWDETFITVDDAKKIVTFIGGYIAQ